MRRLFAFVSFSLIIGSLIIGLGCAFAQQSVNPGSRFALVIGNASYPNADPPLKELVSDARAMGDELRRDGFDVDIEENLDKGMMHAAFRRLYDKLRRGDAALVFFSGYGIQSLRQSYMLPVDAQIFKEEDVRHDGISLDSVLSEMHGRGASVKIAILDASRPNRFENNVRKAPIGLAMPANPPRGSLVLFSAEPGSVVRNANSPFVSELLKEMAAPEPGDEVFKRTRTGVVRATQGEQNPSYASLLNEEFSFRPTIKRPQIPPPTPVALPAPVAPPVSPPEPDKSPSVAPRPAPQSPPPTQQPAKAPPPPKSPEIATLDERIARNPNDPEGFYKRGQVYARDGDFAAAISDFNQTLDRSPTDADALNNRCWARAMINQLREALKDCTDSLQINRKNADALDSRGLVNLKSGRFSDAIADFNAAVGYKKQASSLYGRGLAKLKTGKTTDGNRDIAEAKSMDPGIAEEFARYGIPDADADRSPRLSGSRK